LTVKNCQTKLSSNISILLENSLFKKLDLKEEWEDLVIGIFVNRG